MHLRSAIHKLTTHLRGLLSEGRMLLQGSFGLTPREREGALLVLALFVLGLAIQWLRWLLHK